MVSLSIAFNSQKRQKNWTVSQKKTKLAMTDLVTVFLAEDYCCYLTKRFVAKNAMDITLMRYAL